MKNDRNIKIGALIAKVEKRHINPPKINQSPSEVPQNAPEREITMEEFVIMVDLMGEKAAKGLHPELYEHYKNTNKK